MRIPEFRVKTSRLAVLAVEIRVSSMSICGGIYLLGLRAGTFCCICLVFRAKSRVLGAKARETAAKAVVLLPQAHETAAKAVVLMLQARPPAAKVVVHIVQAHVLKVQFVRRLVQVDEMAAEAFRHLPCVGCWMAQFFWLMSNEFSPPAGGASALDPVTVLAALANDVRWQAMTMMANGNGISASDLAAVSGRDVDSAGKHLRVLRSSGAAAWRAGKDTRFTLYFIPEKFRPQPGVVDCGFCRLQFTPGQA